jgi:peptidylglycine monooxygenase
VDYIPENGDNSGILIHFTNVPQPKLAGVYMTATQGRFPAGITTKAEAACRLNTDLTIHPFAFRVHTHALGKVVTGWKVSPNMEWTLLGKDDPQLPQMFNPVADKTTTLTGTVNTS